MMSISRFLVIFVYFAGLTRIPPSEGLSLDIRHHHPLKGSSQLRIQQSQMSIRRTRLYLRNANGDDNDKKSNSNKREEELSPDVQVLLDPGLWASDFLALILASQLIGLLNILNSPEFVANGGWFQPIPAIPPTLGELVQRISTFGVAWAIASASVVFFAKTTTSADIPQKTLEDSETTMILKRNVLTLAVFGLLLFLGNGIAFGFQGADGLTNADGNQVIPWLNALRNCYYVGLSTSGLRLLYGRYFLLS